MNTKGIIFDFGFTLFYFENPSIETYIDCFNKGLEKSISFLRELKILKSEKDTSKFFKLFNRKRRGLYKKILKTKEEVPSAMFFEEILEIMMRNDVIDKFGTPPKGFYTELADLYHSEESNFWLPFEKTRDTLETLCQYEELKLAVLSNHPHHDCIVNILKKHDLSDYFDTIVTSAGFGKRKPHVDIFHYTIEKMGLDEEHIKDCIMCGDEYADIVGGHRAGMQTVLFNRVYKFPFEKEIPLSDIIKIYNISEILRYIQ